MNPAISAFNFLLGTVFSFYAMVIAIRFVMQALRVDYYNPLAQFVIKVTDPILVPMRRVIPSWGGYDIAALVLCLIVIFLKLAVFKLLQLGVVPAVGRGFNAEALGISHMVVLSILDMLNMFFNIFIFSIIIQAILSWVVQDPGHPLYALLGKITAPVLQPVQRFVPPIGGLDLSPLVALIGLVFIKMLVMGSLVNLFAGG